ncbi:MAG: hypothetical protein ACYDHZ_00645 [Dehalococcoidia bacterium]
MVASVNHKEVVIYLAAAALVGGLIVIRRDEYSVFPAGAFFQPAEVADIAAAIPGDTEDEFVLNAWKYVGGQLAYEPIGSDMFFENGEVKCLQCFMPTEAVKRGKGNCVAKSSLLSSILANYIDTSRIRMVVGEVNSVSSGGHAWVLLNRSGEWDLLESTQTPGSQPWKKADDLTSIYKPSVVLSPESFYCTDSKVCVKLASCDCTSDLAWLLTNR